MPRGARCATLRASTASSGPEGKAAKSRGMVVQKVAPEHGKGEMARHRPPTNALGVTLHRMRLPAEERDRHCECRVAAYEGARPKDGSQAGPSSSLPLCYLPRYESKGAAMALHSGAVPPRLGRLAGVPLLSPFWHRAPGAMGRRRAALYLIEARLAQGLRAGGRASKEPWCQIEARESLLANPHGGALVARGCCAMIARVGSGLSRLVQTNLFKNTTITLHLPRLSHFFPSSPRGFESLTSRLGRGRGQRAKLVAVLR